MDLINMIQTKQDMLDKSIKSLRTTGTEAAATERDYKIALRTEALKLRDNGMAIGMIDKTIYGSLEIAELRFKRDVASTVWFANKEAINSIKLQIRILNDQLSREWGNTK